MSVPKRPLVSVLFVVLPQSAECEQPGWLLPCAASGEIYESDDGEKRAKSRQFADHCYLIVADHGGDHRLPFLRLWL